MIPVLAIPVPESAIRPTPAPLQANTASPFIDGAMTVAAAVDFSGIGRTVLYQHMDGGRLPYSTPGKNRLIARAALVMLLDENAARSAENNGA